MEKATSSLRRGGAMLWSIGSGYQELNLIISELKNLRSHTKAIRDSQQTVLQDMTNWACNDECRALKELFVHLLDLNTLWCEVQTQFADHINDFKHQFEMILEGEKEIDAARNKFSDCEVAEQKAKKKLKKIQKKEAAEEVLSVKTRVSDCERQREVAQTEVSEKVKENEAVKLIRVKEGLLKLSEAYLALSHKCIYLFEAQRDIVKFLPDVQDTEIHEIRFEGFTGAKEIVGNARDKVKDYRSSATVSSPTQQRSPDAPPPYSPNPHYAPTSPYNPYYNPPGGQTTANNQGEQVSSPTAPAPTPTTTAATPVPAPRSGPPNSLYPNVSNDEELIGAMSSAVL